VLEIAKTTRLRVKPLEALDGTPVVDIQPYHITTVTITAAIPTVPSTPASPPRSVASGRSRSPSSGLV
jgi:tRNA (Thr-GGU) A37 N-methylase